MAYDDLDVVPSDLPAIDEEAFWDPHLPALITNVIIEGGDAGEGAANFQARAIDRRLKYLRKVLMALQGSSNKGINLIGALASEDELMDIDTATLPSGTAYWVEYSLRVWNGKEWVSSGYLKGDRGINFLGAWPSSLNLPGVEQVSVGDAYLWRNDIWIFVPNILQPGEDPRTFSPDPVWENLDVRGPDGLSTYDLWRQVPGNENKTRTQFFEAMRGDVGPDPFTAWSEKPENRKKTYADWLVLIRGPEGPAKAPFTVKGTLTNTGLLPNPGKVDEAYYVGIDLYFWVEENQAYSAVAGIVGKSAYDVWREIPGNEIRGIGEFIGSITGPKGDSIKGEPGKDGRNLRVLATLPLTSDIAQITRATDQDAYATLDTGHLWMYLPDEGGWKDLGPWRGVDGRSAYDVWREQVNPKGGYDEFWKFISGKDGISMRVNGVIETTADLPANPADQMLYAVRGERTFYMYLDEAWMPIGTYGRDGKDGIDGKSLQLIKILTEADPTPPIADEENKGKAYLDLNKIIWANVSGTRWENAGPWQGDQGIQGIQGQNFRPMGMVAKRASLDQLEGVVDGDAWVTADDKMMYARVDGVWQGPIDLIGPTGRDGPEGKPGALMPIKGVYTSLAVLKAALPTGQLGDAYMLINEDRSVRNLAIWSPADNDWVDTGPAGIPGPQGESIEGPEGKQGIQGPVGSQWLTLDSSNAPSNTFNGREGDWAVNRDHKVYYKSKKGWGYWGTLVAGDVNSPLESQGYVIRYGNQWVPLPVDEVPNPKNGVQYVRVVKTVNKDGTPNTMGWAAIDLSTYIIDLAEADDKPYVRVFNRGTGQAPRWMALDTSNLGLQDIENPEKNVYYLRFPGNKTWVPFRLPPADGKMYFYKDNVWVAFERYDVKLTTVSATYEIDPTKEQFVKVVNTNTAAKTISLKSLPSDRAMVVIVAIVGLAGGIVYGGTNIRWDQNTVPTLTGTRNYIHFTWDGEVWVGAKGANPTT